MTTATLAQPALSLKLEVAHEGHPDCDCTGASIPKPWADLPIRQVAEWGYMPLTGWCRLCPRLNYDHSWKVTSRTGEEVACDGEPRRLELNAGVTMTVDRIGREVMLVPDWVALVLNPEIKRGWREVPDVNYGQSRDFTKDTAVFAITKALLDAFVASPVPASLSGRDRDMAEADRKRQELYCAIAGVSAWDGHNNWWRDYDGYRQLLVSGRPSYIEDRDCYRYSG